MCRSHLGSEVPREQFVAVLLVVGDDGVERRAQPCVGIDAVELAGFYKRGDDGPVFGTGIMAGKEGVLPIEHDRADGPLKGIVVKFNAAISQEQLEPGLVFGDVAECFPQGALSRRRGRDVEWLLL